MYKNKNLNVLLLILSIAVLVVAFFVGELLLNATNLLPFFIQTGLFLLLVTVLCWLAIFLSEHIHSGGYIFKWSDEFRADARKVALIFLPAAFVLGLITQLLYGMVGVVEAGEIPDFQGTMLVCDISGSMYGNDPQRRTVDAMNGYIDGVELGEYIGIIVFNDMAYTVRGYAPLTSEEERRELKDSISDINYDGGTNIQDSLLSAFGQIRAIGDINWPGLIILLSDGESHVDLEALEIEARGDIGNKLDQISINTIYFSKSPFGSSLMQRIANVTGGRYYYLNASASSSNNVFARSRSLYTISPHLLHAAPLEIRDSVLRIILQILLLSTWGVFTGIAATTMLNNVKLKKAFLFPRIGIAVAVAVIYTLLQLFNPEADRINRVVLLIGLCVMWMPTYSWENR